MNVKIIRSNRKTLAIQINPDLSVTVRAPMYAPQSDIERILFKRERKLDTKTYRENQRAGSKEEGNTRRVCGT